MKHHNALLLTLLSLALMACSGSDSDNNNYDNGLNYSAEITRTEYGIPHVVAKDWGSLGYGHGSSLPRIITAS